MMQLTRVFRSSRWLVAGIPSAIFLVLVAIGCSAGSSYPTKAVELICPSAPGGATDTALRPLADYLGKKWGQPINVTNKTGAGGTQGVLEALRANPDGYVMLGVGNTQGTNNPALEKDLPYKWDEATMVARINVNPMVLTVNADSKYQTAKELLDAIKANPKEFKYGTGSPAGPSTLCSSQILGGYGIDAAVPARVVFQGGAPVIAALAGNNVDWSVSSMSEVQSMVEAKKLRGLAISGFEQRAKQLPTVPTAKEAGVPFFTWVGYTGLWAHSKMPQDIVTKWADGVKEATADKDFIAKLDAVGGVPGYLSPADWKSYMKTSYDETLATLIKLGLKQ